MLIEKTGLGTAVLLGKVVLVTGAGGGIGYETARALAYLGADVVIAEIAEEKGKMAQEAINKELGTDRVVFYHIDLADQDQIDALHHFIRDKYGYLDVMINHATIVSLGAADVVSIRDWDRSYAVNLRAPVLLIQKFLPGMKERGSGVIVFVPSSGAAPYMGAYEVFKTAQIELCNTLAGELDDTDIITYALGPGLIRTETVEKAAVAVSQLMGMTITEFYQMNEKHMISAEEAGTGFAVSIVDAKRYHGQEIGCIQVLMDACIFESEIPEASSDILIDSEKLSGYIESMVRVFTEQYEGWFKRNVFERQWVLRDFKKTVGIAADSFHLLLKSLPELIQTEAFDKIAGYKPHFEKLKEYYLHQHKLLQGYEKNPELLKKNSLEIMRWVKELQVVIDML